jgi:RecB family exonuclease
LSFNGRIDRIDRNKNGRLAVIDYKISDKAPSETRLETNKQLTIYALACQNALFGEIPEELVLFYPLQNTTLSTNRSQEQLKAFEKEMFDLADELNTKGVELTLYKANPAEWKCKTCAYQSQCSAYKDYSSEN